MPTKPLSEIRDQVGETNQTVTGLRVETGKVAEFARATRDDDPVYRDPDAAAERGFEAVPAPLTFTRVAAFPRYRPAALDNRLGFDLGLEPVVIHGEQAYEYDRPVRVGDVLHGETTLAEVYRREGRRGGTMTFVEYETAYYDQGGERVLTERSTAIETGQPIDDGNESEGTGREDTPDPAAVREREDRARYLDIAAGEGTTLDGPTGVVADEVAVGDAGPELVVEDIQRPDFVKYAGASGDFNPVHYSGPYARATGNRAVFGQGMLTAGYGAHMVADWFGLGNVTAYRTRFESRLWPGDTLSVTGEVTDVDSVADGTRVTASLTVESETDTLVTGDATAVLPAR